MFKALFFICVQELFIQAIAGQCYGGRLAIAPIAAAPSTAACPCAASLPGPFETYGCGVAAIAASNGGGFGVSSASAIPPSGVSVLSSNDIEGVVAVIGALPLLGTVALEGFLPTAGAGAVNYGCGNGAVAILAEEVGPVGIESPLGLYAGGLSAGPLAADAYGYGAYGFGIGALAGINRAGCGCGGTLI